MIDLFLFGGSKRNFYAKHRHCPTICLAPEEMIRS